MTREKQEETIIANLNEPLHKCYDCIHWHRNIDPNNRDAMYMSDGSCDHNGYSKCPPLFTCNGWASGNVTIYENIHKTF